MGRQNSAEYEQLIQADDLISGAEAFGVSVTDEMADQFLLYNRMLLEWNHKLNLTALTEPDDVLHKHFLDSLSGVMVLRGREISKLADVGSGAGFPGIPLKIIRPDLEVTLIDSLGKRVDFLNEVIEHLGLRGIAAIHARAEESGHSIEHREQYDCCVTRAVSALPVISEYCLPLVRVGGTFIAYKGPDHLEELRSAGHALEILGSDEAQLQTYNIGPPGDRASRALIVISKTRNTPAKYPRRAGKPNKKPL